MLSQKHISLFLTSITVLVWFVNGLFCKILMFVPRHEEIVTKILTIIFSKEYALYASVLTKMIGFAELVMVIWILSRFKRNWCAFMQIFIVILMNIIEFLLAPELLLFGKINIFIALAFATLVYYDNFVLQKNK